MYIKVKATGSDSLITIPNVTLIKEIQSDDVREFTNFDSLNFLDSCDYIFVGSFKLHIKGNKIDFVVIRD